MSGIFHLKAGHDGLVSMLKNLHFRAFGLDLAVVPVINKIDLPGAKPDSVKEQLLTLFDIEPGKC